MARIRRTVTIADEEVQKFLAGGNIKKAEPLWKTSDSSSES
jgi:hypothetical protein